MSRSFYGVGDYSLDLNNGLSARLLNAMGYSGSLQFTDGEMRIEEAFIGIEKASHTVAPEDARYLFWLEELVLELHAAGHTKLEWA